MILDERLEFADALALNLGAPGDFVLGDIVDLTKTGLDIGAGTPGLYLMVTVDTAATSGGAATLAVSFGTSDDSGLAGATKVTTSPAVALASLVAGAVVYLVELPPAVYKRYIGLIQTTGGAAFTAGKINAFLVDSATVGRLYADAI